MSSWGHKPQGTWQGKEKFPVLQTDSFSTSISQEHGWPTTSPLRREDRTIQRFRPDGRGRESRCSWLGHISMRALGEDEGKGGAGWEQLILWRYSITRRSSGTGHPNDEMSSQSFPGHSRGPLPDMWFWIAHFLRINLESPLLASRSLEVKPLTGASGRRKPLPLFVNTRQRLRELRG